MVEKRLISGQLRLGDAELTSFSLDGIIGKISAAHKLAGLSRLIFLPSLVPDINQRVLEHCRNLGIEVYLWYKVLTDNPIQAERTELNEDAWGKRGAGESGVWSRIFDSEEAFLFACPRNRKYNAMLLKRCQQALERYDGLFADAIGFPLPSLGLESVFACFCDECMEQEPRLKEWRRRVIEMRETAISASDADLEKWSGIEGVIKAFGLADFFEFRRQSVLDLTARYAKTAKKAGKGFGLDLVSPSLANMAGHSYERAGQLADWVKPRIYWRIFGPSSIPVEFYSLTMGMMAWGKRYTIPGVLRYIERSSGIKMPNNVHSLAQNFLSDRNVLAEIVTSNQLATCPVHPGFECSLHPDYNTGVDDISIKTFLDFTKSSPGLVLTWNLLYVPETSLRLIGEYR